MFTFWGIVTAATVYGGIPTVTGLWLFERWRARKRNRAGECSACGRKWRDVGEGEPFLIHGRLVCDDCAEATRRRIPFQIGAVGAATLFAAGGIFISGGLTPWILYPVVTTAALGAVVVQLMKRANRRAERQIAAGDYPDLYRGSIEEVEPEALLAGATDGANGGGG